MLVTMMIPWMAGIVPWFILISKWLHWINRYEALIIPGAASAFGIFWMRQYIQESIPHELLDAARIDGCHEFTIFFRIVAPLLMPAFAALGIMIFVGNWNAFLGRCWSCRKRRCIPCPSHSPCCARIRGVALMPACSCWARRWRLCPC